MSANEYEVGYKNSALIVWDVQNGVARKAFNYDAIIPKIKLLITAAHSAHRPVIFSQQTGVSYENLTKYQIYSSLKRGIDPTTTVNLAEGSLDWKIVEDLQVSARDVVLRKYTPSFFVGTMLDQILRRYEVDTVIMTGTNTEAGIEGTARHAAALGYIPVIAEDAVGSGDRVMHEHSLEYMRRVFPVPKTQDIIQKL